MPRFNDVPFNFVPLNHEVFIPSWGSDISQDIPFEDGEDGIISFEITNTTPLFIKNGMTDSGEDVMSANVIDANGNRHYYIPATSLKGMIRSVLEILSFSKMKQYNDDYFGYRIFDTRQTDGKSYVEKMKGNSCGWLKKCMGKEGNDKYVLVDCGEIQRIEMAELPDYYRQVVEKDLVKKIEYFREAEKETYPKYEGNPKYEGKRLVCTGSMYNKKNEYLFPEPSEGTEIEVDKDVVKAFLSVYKPSKVYYEFIQDMLKRGEPLAVFFTRSDNKVSAVGITRMFRNPYKHSVQDGVKQEYPTDGLDLSECIFGYINRHKSLRGRVQIGNAFAVDVIGHVDNKRGVLGQPNASYYPYYLRQRGHGYSTYSSDWIEIAGRKRYRVHSQDNITELSQGNGKESVMKTLNLLPVGNRFLCNIKVHNLRPAEIGALLSAITFHEHSECHHNIGMAKAMGYGRLDISDIQLQYLSHDVKFYMAEFEKHMSRFKANWVYSEQVRALLQIATDHNNTLGYMNFEGYKNGKRNDNFSELTEASITTQSLLTPLELRKSQYSDKYQEIEQQLKDGNYNDVLTLCNVLEKSLKPYDDPSIKNYRITAQNKMQEKETEARALEEEQQLEEIRRRIEKGLRAFLDEKNNKGEYKVRDFKMAINKIAKWEKDKERVTGCSTFSEEELSDLQKSLSRIYNSLTKPKEKKGWEHGGSWWRSLAQHIGNETANNIFKSVIG